MNKHWLKGMLALLALLLAAALPMVGLAEVEVEAEAEATVAELGEVDLYAPDVYVPAPGEEVAPNVALDKEHFPDDIFRDYLKKKFDRNGDGVLSDAECQLVTFISVNRMGISSLKGIGYFRNLKYLFARGNRLYNLDLTNNTALEEVEVSENQLSSLPVGELENLQKLCCYGNKIQRMNTSKNSYLYYLDCQGNGMVDLYIGANSNMQTVICFDNKLPQLDLRYLPNLEYVDAWNNNFKRLTVKNNDILTRLRVHGNPIETLDISGCPNLIEFAEESAPDVNAVRAAWGHDLIIPAKTKLIANGRVLYQGSKPTSVSLDRTSLSMKVGQKVTLKATVKPQGAVTKLTWMSSNASVASVNSQGQVSANSTGSATITVKTANGKKATCKVTVSASGSTATCRALLIGQEAFNPICTRNRGSVGLMKKMLGNVKGPGGETWRITEKFNQSSNDVKNAIKNTFAGAKANDISLFFIATHGDNVSTGRYAGALQMIPSSEFLLMEELASALKAIPGKVIVLIDACGSGGGVFSTYAEQNADMNAIKAGVKRFDQSVIDAFADVDTGVEITDAESNTGELRVANKFYVMTAARYQEYSWGSEYYGYTYFTNWLCQGVGASGHMPADTDDNNKVTLNEMFKYISKVGDHQWFSDGKVGGYQHVQAYPRNSGFVMFKR